MRPQGIDQLGALAYSQFARVFVFLECRTRAMPDSRTQAIRS
jgi:hypothetical protein